MGRDHPELSEPLCVEMMTRQLESVGEAAHHQVLTCLPPWLDNLSFAARWEGTHVCACTHIHMCSHMACHKHRSSSLLKWSLWQHRQLVLSANAAALAQVALDYHFGACKVQ